MNAFVLHHFRKFLTLSYFPKEPSSLVISIVSHGHARWILPLLCQIAAQKDAVVKRVVLTLNIPEPALEQALEQKGFGGANVQNGFAVEVIRNPKPQGFGRNHNVALANAKEDAVCILNPDITLTEPLTFSSLCAVLALPSVGLAYPTLKYEDGTLQDNERALPTLGRLLKRRIGGRLESSVDWVSGACLAMRAKDWLRLGGFDERFFMYCEDVDLSLRVRQQIGILQKAKVTLIHQGQRTSRRQFKFLMWHIRSLLLLWSLPSFKWGQQNLMKQIARENVN